MKNRFTIISFFITLLCALIIISCNSQNTEKLKAYNLEQDPMAIPDLLERKGDLANAAEWKNTQQKINELKTKITQKPEDAKLRLQAATIFIAEQRITGEHHYYFNAIEKILNGVLSLDPKNFEATVYKASLMMSRHKFAEAKKLAEEAKTINPNNAYVYGILADANVELGNYDDAVAASDKMQSLKPSLESYSRASYLREIYGDTAGAVAAMKMAVTAGLPGSEPQSWSRNVLGDLYYNSNQLDKAAYAYEENLVLRPSYAPSMAGLAKVEMKRKNFERALRLLDSANAVMPQPSYDEQKGDVYMAMGDSNTAGKRYYEIQQMLLKDAESPDHSVSLELAGSFIKTNDWDSAKKYALLEYNIRPKNIDVNNELAWIAYNMKDHVPAKELILILD